MDNVEIVITPSNSFYPSSCVTDADKRAFDRQHLKLGLPIPASHRLPKDSLVYAEARRIEANSQS